MDKKTVKLKLRIEPEMPEETFVWLCEICKAGNTTVEEFLTGICVAGTHDLNTRVAYLCKHGKPLSKHILPNQEN